MIAATLMLATVLSAPPEEPRRFAAYVRPLGVAQRLIGGLPGLTSGVLFESETGWFSVELAAVYRPRTQASLIGISTSAGFLAGADHRRSGSFVEPRTMYARLDLRDAIDAWDLVSGLEVGWRLPAERLLLILSLGASVGWGFKAPNFEFKMMRGLFSMGDLSDGELRHTGIVFELNADLIRIGFRF